MILVRHGESHFNRHYGATREDPGIADPGLTHEGIEQARQAARLVASLARATELALRAGSVEALGPRATRALIIASLLHMMVVTVVVLTRT